MNELKFLNNEESVKKGYSFTYLTTSMAYAREEKEDYITENLGNTLINQVF